jgi:uncharacterized protein (TIGR02452 family)
MAAETDAIVAAGGYEVGHWVDLTAALAAARHGSHLHHPDDPLAADGDGTAGPPVVEVTGETTLAAARRLHAEGDRPVACLNFASARKPGGGWRNGAEAQEESLARASALGTCLDGVPEFYEFHRHQQHPVYSDRVICSPAVPVFRDDDGHLLDEPCPVTFLTAAAPNAGALRRRDDWRGDVAEVLRRRARRVLAVAATHQHHDLVLGAWGCGVFRNDPRVVAGVFADVLASPVGASFRRVTFAVYDTTPGATTRAAFRDALRRLTG